MSLLFTDTGSPAPLAVRETTDQILTQPLIDADDLEYRTLGSAPRDLLGTTLHRAQNLCVALYRANPVANRMINIYRSYLAGNGFAVGAGNPEVQVIVDEFWTSPRSRMDRHHRDFARDWLLMGEGFFPIKPDEPGNSTIGFIDPTTVMKVRRSPLNNLILEKAFIQQPGGGGEHIELDIYQVNGDILSDRAGLWEGQTTAFLFDRIAASSRGTPFLLDELDWLDAYDQVLWEMLERQKAMRAHFWDVEVEGGQNEVDEAKALWGTSAPRTGSVRFRTDKFKIGAVAPQLGHYEDVNTSRYHLRHLATGAGLPPHWLGEPEDANRSTAEAMEGPTLRSLKDTQAEWKLNVTEILEIVVDNKVAAGMLDRVVERHDGEGNPTGDMMPARELVTVTVPEIDSSSVVQAAESLAAVAQAFVQLDMLGAIGKDTMVKIVRQMLPALGIPAEELPDPGDDPGVAAVIEAYARNGDAGFEALRRALHG